MRHFAPVSSSKVNNIQNRCTPSLRSEPCGSSTNATTAPTTTRAQQHVAVFRCYPFEEEIDFSPTTAPSNTLTQREKDNVTTSSRPSKVMTHHKTTTDTLFGVSASSSSPPMVSVSTQQQLMVIPKEFIEHMERKIVAESHFEERDKSIAARAGQRRLDHSAALEAARERALKHAKRRVEAQQQRLHSQVTPSE